MTKPRLPTLTGPSLVQIFALASLSTHLILLNAVAVCAFYYAKNIYAERGRSGGDCPILLAAL
jgi:hypothetical protein